MDSENDAASTEVGGASAGGMISCPTKLEPKKCRFHGGGRSDQLRQKKVKVRLSGRITPADLYYVTKLKAAIAEHERKAAALREALEILEK